MSKSRECLTEEQIREAFNRWCCGDNICDIAEEYYVCTRTLMRMFKRRGLRKITPGSKCH